MEDDNAYSPTFVSVPSTKRKTNWRRRFAMLNAVLLGMPLLLVAMAWLALSANGTQLSGTSGSVGIATIAVAGAYFVIPNLVMLLVWTVWRDRTTPPADQKAILNFIRKNSDELGDVAMYQPEEQK